MTNLDQSYTEMINNIKQELPRIQDPQRLTAGIISNIEKSNRHPKHLYLVSWISSVAAMFLVGLLLDAVIWEPSNYAGQAAVRVDYRPRPAIENFEKGCSMEQINIFVRAQKQQQKERDAFLSSIYNKINK